MTTTDNQTDDQADDQTDQAADTTQDGDDQPEATGGNAEAAKLRHQRNEARQERDQLAEKITAAENRILTYSLEAAGLDPRLWEVSEQNLDDFRDDDGHLDIGALIERAKTIRTELGLTGPRPNPQQGQPSNSPKGTLEAAFDWRTR